MNKFTRDDYWGIAAIGMFLLLIFLAGYFVGNLRGYGQGLDKAMEIQRKVDCTSKYSNVSIDEVPIKCWKYFDVKK